MPEGFYRIALRARVTEGRREVAMSRRQRFPQQATIGPGRGDLPRTLGKGWIPQRAMRSDLRTSWEANATIVDDERVTYCESSS
jgi:hypothetical protein